MDDLQTKTGRNKEDRISTLPDELLHHILSFVESSLAVQTCVLSKRWVNLWSTLPFLNFDLRHLFRRHRCYNYTKFTKFVNDFLVNRNQQSYIRSIEIDFRRFESSLSRPLFNYATSHHIEQFSHHIEQFRITAAKIDFLVNFPNLTNLSLKYCIVNLVDWSLPSLRTLYLQSVTPSSSGKGQLSFEGFPNLKILIQKDCPDFSYENVATINCPNLTSLTISQNSLDRSSTCTFMITAPNLSSFEFQGKWVPTLCAVDGFSLLNQVKLDIGIHMEKYIHMETYKPEFNSEETKKQEVQKLINLFHELQTTKFLKLSFLTIEVLSRLPSFLEDKPSPFDNLKSLNLIDSELESERLTNFRGHAINYLISSSPHAKIFIKGLPRSDDLNTVI